MCNKTSPLAGAYTGAFFCFKLWSAVTCSEGFGNDVVMVARAAQDVLDGNVAEDSALFVGAMIEFSCDGSLTECSIINSKRKRTQYWGGGYTRKRIHEFSGTDCHCRRNRSSFLIFLHAMRRVTPNCGEVCSGEPRKGRWWL